jgi:hypothetical protein
MRREPPPAGERERCDSRHRRDAKTFPHHVSSATEVNTTLNERAATKPEYNHLGPRHTSPEQDQFVWNDDKVRR